MLRMDKVECNSSSDIPRLYKMLSAFSSWQLGNLELESRYLNSSSMSKVRGETDDRLHSEEVWCRSSSDVSNLCQFLANFRQWSLGKLCLGYSYWMTSDNWLQLAAVAGKGKIDKVRVSKWYIQQGRSEDVEAVKRITQEWEEW